MSFQHTNESFGFGDKTLSYYVIGFGFSLLLTIIAFYCVAEKIFTSSGSYIVLTILAITQLIVQSVCFIRLISNRAGQWNLLPFLFVILIIVFLVGGSLWIMYNLNYNFGLK